MQNGTVVSTPAAFHDHRGELVRRGHSDFKGDGKDDMVW